MKKVYFVRHGQTNANIERYVGGKDEPLNEVGLLQAAQIAERTSHMDFDTLMASDFLRAQQTADAIAKVKGLEVLIDPVFGEMLEPTSMVNLPEDAEVVLNFRKARNENLEQSSWSFEDGQSYQSVFDRVKKAEEHLTAHPSETILVTSHAFFIRLFGAHILLGTPGPTRDWLRVADILRVSNTGVSLFTFDEKGWRLAMWNDHAHFAE